MRNVFSLFACMACLLFCGFLLSPPVVAQSDASGVAAAGALPSAFIALAPDEMNHADAMTYCAKQGGSLPLIDGKTSLDFPPNGLRVDGFGLVGDPWPCSLPNANFWSGTAHGSFPGNFWVMDGDNLGNYICLTSISGHNKRRVACVPEAGR
ncbi:hypothetical protein LJC59_09110 [Desulfovibrio sp. OttesenSCG-928-A18]|nr:hypothetical protein [Desulfovibrio sp. OttesenSCG-928-A18]